jgi:hypothetical protein
MKLDAYILKPYYKAFIVLYVIASVIGALTKIQVLTIVFIMIITAPFIGLYFSVYEKNGLSRLYGILPLGKTEVVIGRYLYALFLGIANGIVSVVQAYIISYFTGVEIDYLTLITVISVSFLYFCLFVAVLFPIYFRFPFSKVYIFANLPLYLIGVAGIFVIKKTDFLKNLGNTIQYFTSNQNMIWVMGFGAGLILLAISLYLSNLTYKKNEL